MEIKLQQAIVAARAGHFETAQLLLTEAIGQNPEDANAWFLLAHLVNSPERQALYLENTLVLQPEHVLAKEHLARLYRADVPPPIIKSGGELASNPSQATPVATIDTEFAPLPPSRVNASPPAAGYSAPSPSPAPVLGQPPSEPPSKSVDPNWSKVAGSPKRAKASPTRSTQRAQAAPVEARAQPAAAKTVPAAAPKKQPVNMWLLGILVVLVAVAAFVFGYFAYTIFFQ